MWKGKMFIGGLNGTEEIDFELFLELDGKIVKGRSYVHLKSGEVIEMNVKGRIYEDRSLYLHEIEFIPGEDESFTPPFKRKYQFLYSRSFNSGALKGYWQEIITSPFDEHRERGRIELKKIPETKA